MQKLPKSFRRGISRKFRRRAVGEAGNPRRILWFTFQYGKSVGHGRLLENLKFWNEQSDFIVVAIPDRLQCDFPRGRAEVVFSRKFFVRISQISWAATPSRYWTSFSQ